MKLLFIMHSPEYLRFYDSVIEECAARGWDVRLAVSNPQERKPVGLEGLQAYAGRVRVLGVVPEHTGVWGEAAFGLRAIMDFVRYLHPRFAAAPALRARIKRKVLPAAFQWIDAIPSLPPAIVAAALRALAACERAIPVSPAIAAYLRQQAPDVLLVSPLVTAASEQVDWIKAARACGVRSAVGIASWDNLTNKGLMRVEPDLVLVWNDAQKREAEQYHGILAGKIVATGAQLFDRWFVRRPSRARGAFCTRVGLPDAQPFVLFTGSSYFISESGAEVAFVRRWIAAVRSSPDPWIRDLHILVRPHPYNCRAWERDDLSDLRGVTVYPRAGYNPVDEENRADFFDSLYYAAAVVGINTSAMIEAAIVGRPVFSMLTEEFAKTQEGTIHFHHLLPEHGGCVRMASTLAEHVAQLGARLQDPEAARAETQSFVASFLRPHGLDRPATPIVVDALERLAAAPAPAPARAPWWAPAARPAILTVAAIASAIDWLEHPDSGVRLRRRIRQRVHRLGKQLRTAYRVLIDRSVRRVRKLVKRPPRLPSIRKPVLRAASRSWRQVRRQARHARYQAAVFVKGAPPGDDRRG